MMTRTEWVRSNCRFAQAGENPAEYIRYVHKDGLGLMNNQGLDRSKLSDDEESELIELMDFGLQQPRDVPAGAVFAFTPDGVRRHARLIELLAKASRKGVRKTRLSAKDFSVVWQSDDGQAALLPIANQPN